MEESKNIIRGIGECFCLKSPYKHFIIASIEESIQKRDEDIDIIKKAGEDIRRIKKAGEDIRRIKGIKSHKDAEAMIDVHRSTKEELTKVRNMVHDIPSCKT